MPEREAWPVPCPTGASAARSSPGEDWRCSTSESSSRTMCIGSIGRGSQAIAPCGALAPTNTVSGERPAVITACSDVLWSASAMTKSLRSMRSTCT